MKQVPTNFVVILMLLAMTIMLTIGSLADNKSDDKLDTILTEVQAVRDENRLISQKLQALEIDAFGAPLAEGPQEEEKLSLAIAQKKINQSRDLPDLAMAAIKMGSIWIDQEKVGVGDRILLVACQGDRAIFNLKNKHSQNHNGEKIPLGTDRLFLVLSREFIDKTGTSYRDIFKQIIEIKMKRW